MRSAHTEAPISTFARIKSPAIYLALAPVKAMAQMHRGSQCLADNDLPDDMAWYAHSALYSDRSISVALGGLHI